MAQATEKQGRRAAEMPPPAEWVAGGVGLVLLSASIAFLLWQALGGADTAPMLDVEVSSVAPQADRYLVQFTVRNEGGITASDVLIEGTLESGGKPVESSEVTVDYVPPHSQRTGGLIFSRNPGGLELELRAHGYREP